MIYVTGCNGFIGSTFLNSCDLPITKVHYRDDVTDVFESHEKSCLLHFAWSTTTRTSYDDLEIAMKNDVFNSKKLFDFYSKKNPNGKIIFLSSAGDLHSGHERTVSESFEPVPKTLYGDCKLQVEHILNNLSCNTTILRVSNVWGGKNLDNKRSNGLIDKLIQNLNSSNQLELYANLYSRIDIIHVNDLIELIIKIIEKDNYMQHETYLVGNQSLTICDIIDKISSNGSLLLKFNKKEIKTYLHVENTKVKRAFDWNPSRHLV